MEGKTAEEIEEMIAEKEAKARATILEMVGDLPSAEVAPPENVLFVCKLNPVTTDDDLMIIFSRFGRIVRYIDPSHILDFALLIKFSYQVVKLFEIGRRGTPCSTLLSSLTILSHVKMPISRWTMC